MRPNVLLTARTACALALVLVMFIASPLAVRAQDARIALPATPSRTVVATGGMVVAQEKMAAEVGAAVLARG